MTGAAGRLKGVRVGPYELRERIGMGGMAEVFLARQEGADGFERLVAIKRILPGIAEDEDFVKMFIDEAKIAVRLSHPNIAQIFDLGHDGDVYYIAQEYVPGRDMGAIVERQGQANVPLPLPFVLFVAQKICEALQHAHEARGPGGRPLGVIHRDVSPSNILVSFEGAVKVIDFGLAKAAGRLVTTQAGVVKGKLAYLSAEQARGEDIDSRSDLFSLGTCLFEWLTGQRLFLRRNDPETVMAVQKAEVPPLRALNPEVPPALQAIVLRALEPDPNRRFQSAAEMQESLLGFTYEHRLLMRRKAVGEYLRTLFPEADGDEDPDAVVPARDTMPSAPGHDVDEETELLADESLAELVEEVEDDEGPDPLDVMTTVTGARAAAILDEGAGADEGMGEGRREGMAEFEDTTTPSGSQRAAEFEDTTAASSRGRLVFEDTTSPYSSTDQPLDELLARARATKPRKRTADPIVDEDLDFDDQTAVEPLPPLEDEDTNPHG